jgi:Bacterial capsule synthesis protein PGA_cap
VRGLTGWTALLLCAFAGTAQAASLLRCELEQGGSRTTVEARPVRDPYAAARVPMGRFGFKAMWVDDGTQPAYIKLSTYAGAALVHQASFAVPTAGAAQPAPRLQRVYAPGLGQELSYRCTVQVDDAVPAPPVTKLLPGLNLAFVGDVLLDDTPGRVIRQGRDPFRPFAPWLARADVRVANLECVVARSGRAEPVKPFTFRAHPRVLPVLARHFDVVGLANNHSGDFGPAAFTEMLGRLRQQGLRYYGGGEDLAQAHAPLVIERRGLRIALLGYNEFMPRHFEADVGRPGIAWSEDEQVWLDIQRARRVADVVIPVMHWGQEHEPLANARQRALARLMIDAGADAVVGGHPHVTQDLEIYSGRPIIYSLGNFLFDGFTDEDNNTAWLLQLQLDADGVSGLQVVSGRIDREGIPHPLPSLPAPCWRRGQAEVAMCRPAELRAVVGP